MKRRIAISIGDPNGIGPEVALKAVAELREQIHPVLVGSAEVLRHYAQRLYLQELLTHVEIEEVDPAPSEPVEEGQISETAGNRAMAAVTRAVELCAEGRTDALVTAPIHKAAIRKAGYDFPGHTEYLAHLTSGTPVMLMAAGALRIAVLTTHIPLREVADAVTVGSVQNMLVRLHRGLQSDFGLSSPRIALLGLNPHAGEGGAIGSEEGIYLLPAITLALSRGVNVEGPFSADAFFGRQAHKQYDAVLACYHDQGLIPFKTLAMGGGVNVTLGLPVIRTSPDHGTAFDIAGRGIAEPDSMIAAIRLAARISDNRAR